MPSFYITLLLQIAMIRRFFLLFASLLLANFNWANDFSEAYMQGNDFSTPRRSVANFIANLQDDNYHPELAVKSFNFTKVKGRDNKQEHALLLKKYIDAKGYLIDEALLSDKKDYYDSSLGINRFYPFIKEPRIYLELYNGKWLISKTTVAQINTLYHEAYPFGSSWFLKLLPRQMKTTLFWYSYLEMDRTALPLGFLVGAVLFLSVYCCRKCYQNIRLVG